MKKAGGKSSQVPGRLLRTRKAFAMNAKCEEIFAIEEKFLFVSFEMENSYTEFINRFLISGWLGCYTICSRLTMNC